MSSIQSVIATERLDLVSMSPRFLRCTQWGWRAEANAILGLEIPPAWFECGAFAALRLDQLESGATSIEWLPRAIVLREPRVMVGYIGFHTNPAPPYLKQLSPAGVEFGYTVFPDYRRRGIAVEAVNGLLDWARRVHGVRAFVASVSPVNAASLALITKLGFRRIGSHVDEEDGPEDIFEKVFDAPSQ